MQTAPCGAVLSTAFGLPWFGISCAVQDASFDDVRKASRKKDAAKLI